MKKTIILLTLVICNFVISQEKKISGIQAGVLGIGVYNERKLSKKWVFRSEIKMLLNSIWGGDFYKNTGFLIIPGLSISPKYYYNIDKRNEKGRNINNNSANYISLEFNYFPNWFEISNYEKNKRNDLITLAPMWGFRRNFYTNFNYELKLGLGLGKELVSQSEIKAVPNFSIKVGYDF